MEEKMIEHIDKPEGVFGPVPDERSIKAAILVIRDGWSAYAAARYLGVTAPTVRRQVRNIKSGKVHPAYREAVCTTIGTT